MRPISHCLNPKLLEICQQAILIEELDSKVKHFLPEGLREHCKVASFTKGSLILVSNDAVWVSQLRYSLPELRDKLRCEAGLYQLISIKVTVATEKPKQITEKVRNSLISAEASQTIMSEANACNYMPLKDALKRLAHHGVKSTK